MRERAALGGLLFAARVRSGIIAVRFKSGEGAAVFADRLALTTAMIASREREESRSKSARVLFASADGRFDWAAARGGKEC
jgi:hypothetical protein